MGPFSLKVTYILLIVFVGHQLLALAGEPYKKSMTAEQKGQMNVNSNSKSEKINVGSRKTNNYRVSGDHYKPTQMTQVVLNVPPSLPAPAVKNVRKSRPPTEEEMEIKYRIMGLFEAAVNEKDGDLYKNHLRKVLEALNPKYIASQRVHRVVFADPKALQVSNDNSESSGDTELDPTYEPTYEETQQEMTAKVQNQLDDLLQKFAQEVQFTPAFLDKLARSDESVMSPAQLAFKRVIVCISNPDDCNADQLGQRPEYQSPVEHHSEHHPHHLHHPHHPQHPHYAHHPHYQPPVDEQLEQDEVQSGYQANSPYDKESHQRDYDGTNYEQQDDLGYNPAYDNEGEQEAQQDDNYDHIPPQYGSNPYQVTKSIYASNKGSSSHDMPEEYNQHETRDLDYDQFDPHQQSQHEGQGYNYPPQNYGQYYDQEEEQLQPEDDGGPYGESPQPESGFGRHLPKTKPSIPQPQFQPQPNPQGKPQPHKQPLGRNIQPSGQSFTGTPANNLPTQKLTPPYGYPQTKQPAASVSPQKQVPAAFQQQSAPTAATARGQQLARQAIASYAQNQGQTQAQALYMKENIQQKPPQKGLPPRKVPVYTQQRGSNQSQKIPILHTSGQAQASAPASAQDQQKYNLLPGFLKDAKQPLVAISQQVPPPQGSIGIGPNPAQTTKASNQLGRS